MDFVTCFSQVVKNNKNNPALTDRDGDRTLTYGEFDKLSGKVAAKLKSIGIKEHEAVIIKMGRTCEYMAAEIGIMKINAVVVPLIPEYPQDRVDYIKHDSGASVVIEDSFFNDINNYPVEESAEAAENDRTMIIYTSGSTGKPKGVVYTRKNIYDQIERAKNCVEGVEPLIFAACGSMSFAITISDEYYRTFAMGGHIHMLSEEVRADVRKVEDYYAKNHITAGFLSPRVAKLYKNKDKDLQRILVAGEKAVELYSDEYKIYNLYGLSETYVFSEFLINKLYNNTPVGKPRVGVEIRILDADGNQVPSGKEGEICPVGYFPCEYNNLPDETARVFKKLEDGRILVHTGDIGKYLDDGNLLFLNRNDWMIKVHGQRVEPGEIETVMNETDGVTGSIVKAFEQKDGTMMLCGFYTSDKDISKESIKAKLRSKLPAYMIPGVYVKMDEFPVNANGKIDRKSLKKPDLSYLLKEYEAPASELEAAICKAMELVLDYDRIGRNDDFFALGGNSLNAVALTVECNIEGLTAQHVMMGKTPKGIAEKFTAMSHVLKPALHKAKETRKRYPLTNAQIYQLYECEKIGYTIDFNDWRGFWLLDDGIDIEKLKKAVVDTYNSHAGMNVKFDLSGEDEGEMIACDTWDRPTIEEIDIAPDDFKAYRLKKEKEKRDVLNHRLYELAILHVGAETYLYMNINHFLYDESGLKLLLEEITSRYETGKFTINEEINVFDLSLYEEEIKKSPFYSDAMDFYDKRYGKLQESNMIPRGENQISLAFRVVAENLKREKIDQFFRDNGISEISYLQAAYSLALMSVFKKKEFAFMTVYDGRAEAKLRTMYGDLARSVYMVADWTETETVKEYLERVQEEYQQAIYFDTVDTVQLSKKYPAMRNDVYLNFRGDMTLDIELSGKIAKQLPIGNSYEGDRIGTVLNFVIEFTPEKQYKVFGTAGYFDKAKLNEVVDAFERILIQIIDGSLEDKVKDILEAK